MDHGRVAEIEVVLEGIDLPASREQLIAYAAKEDAAAAQALRVLPDREYRYLDQVGEVLLRTQPSHRVEQKPPKPESGRPPGHDDYLKPHPEPGHIRPSVPPSHPPQETLEKQSKTQKRQKAVQQGDAEKAG